MTVKIALAFFLLIVSATGIGFLFWNQEIRYTLPTPLPKNYQPPALQTRMRTNLLPVSASVIQSPVFIHFFNPECPCSRFNLKEFRNLVRLYGKQVQFVVVFQTDQEGESASQLSEKLDLRVPAVIDAEGKIAEAYGVYSTPQAVLLDSEQRLYYRGNYNKTRYCTHPQTAYAHQALLALLAHEPLPLLPDLATRAYGCELPGESTWLGPLPEQ